MRYTVKPHNVCAASLSFDLDGDVVRNVEFTRGLAHLVCQAQKFLHFPGDPFILVVENLPPGLHLEAANI